jgi:3-oxoacyl-[acyl-carrier protein] reductase
MAAALLIAEFARRHVARGADWGRIIGLTSGAEMGLPEEVSDGAANAAQVNYTMPAAIEPAPHGITANMLQPPVTGTGWVTAKVRDAAAAQPWSMSPGRPTLPRSSSTWPRMPPP